jgi:DNA-binding SARP family transcriptional activator
MSRGRRPDLVESASDAALAIGEDLRVLGGNAPAQRLLGYSRHEMQGRRCYEVLRAVLPTGAPLCGPSCDGISCVTNCKPFSVPACLVLRRDGQWFPVALSTLILPGAVRSAARMLILIRPRSDLAEAAVFGSCLRIFTLGRFRMVFRGRDLGTEKWVRKHSVQLLKLLASCPGNALHRGRLIERLWSDANEKRGRERLKVTVCYLRRQLMSVGLSHDVVSREGESYLLRREAMWLDARTFERLAVQGMRLAQQHELERALHCYEDALALYKGDYLEEDLYADWCAEERERLRELCLEVIARTAAIHARLGRYEQAVQLCRRGLIMEPCRESMHRTLMMYLFQLGRRSSALAQYRRCRELLRREFGVEPLPITQALYRRILEPGALSFDT